MTEQFDKESLDILKKALQVLENGFNLPSVNSFSQNHSLFNILIETAEKLKDNYPYFHPLYAGQMLKPPHPIARLAYMLSMWINPNNHALDGGRASSQMEKEAVAELAKMFGWEMHLGHLTGGGTMANLEALWISGRLFPDKKIAASEQAHYTHSRICNVLKIDYESIPCTRLGRIDLKSLEKKLKEGKIGTVVATIGTTACGAVDELYEIIELKKKYEFRLHADAAYGGYFILTDNLSAETRKSYDLINEADSIVIDPHKHGLQPYGCGCILFKDPSVGRFYKHDSPYTYFSSKELHLGEISLECSRAGASAVGLWATQKYLPLTREGEFSKMLSKGRNAAQILYERLKKDKRFLTAFPPELDIIVWAPDADTTDRISDLSHRIFDEAAKNNLHLALAELPVKFFHLNKMNITKDTQTITCLRSVLMKPEHESWIDKIWEILDKSTNAVLNK